MSKTKMIFISDNFQSYCTLITKVIQKQPIDKIYFTQKPTYGSLKTLSQLEPWLKDNGYPGVTLKPMSNVAMELAITTDLTNDQIHIFNLMIAQHRCSTLSVGPGEASLRKYPNFEHWDAEFFHGVLNLADLPKKLLSTILGYGRLTKRNAKCESSANARLSS